MQLKVIHLLNHLEKINRDLQEIDALQASIKDDRNYSQKVRSSLKEESVRLRRLQAKIETQTVLNAPAELATRSASAPARGPAVTASATAPNPELFVPGKSAPKGPAPTIRKPEASAKSGPARRTSTQKKEEDFSWKFVQEEESQD
ncbi:MAG: hypothetical protein H7A21_05285 [Spirochaetales bacterium]|nr:hypothetical protein [Leptospiraceae bacterium]MCP5480828.1 hypothetical protein [Spirochaetales bacterium]